MAQNKLIQTQKTQAPQVPSATHSSKLVVYISGHGYGHVAQVAPVLNQLGQRYPQLQLLICSAVSEAFLRSRIHVTFSYQPRSADFGMLMQSAFKVDVAASVAAYIAFHSDWQQKLDSEIAWLREQQATAVFCNVAYLPLAAAQQLGLPALALCSLNWADILEYYAPAHPALLAAQQQIRAAYASSLFLRPSPSMPMPWLHSVEIGPLADPLPSARQTLVQSLGLNADSRLVLVGMGGIETQVSVQAFPRIAGVHWLLPREWLPVEHADNPESLKNSENMRDDFHAQQDIPLGFSSLIVSVDLVLTKPGYGTFVEAACHGLPVLYVPRDGWPEQDDLIAWLQAHGQCLPVTEDALRDGEFAQPLQQLLALPKSAPVQPVGNQQAASLLARHLGI